jgi:16S rRNA (guanine966-N2)-methyltransferase
VGGAWRERALTGPGAAGGLRPTQDRVRESLFNVLGGGRFGDPVTGARVLDLFAGTGALALEALSRGAAQAVLVDDGRPAARLIAQNTRACDAGARVRHLRRDATRLGPNDGAPFDLVFLDPPYGRGLGEAALDAARAGGWIAPGALVIWEESAPITPPAGLHLLETRRYGDTILTFLRAEADGT